MTLHFFREKLRHRQNDGNTNTPQMSWVRRPNPEDRINRNPYDLILNHMTE